ncbi:heavy metal translocating P-type ATPase [Atopococcus tabaci]|uniref:heavy metal translocating P-type ATPase n=1 Tax=Atopococcus tabaci TaxID=269774 RepID=UPI00041DDE03|nr:heavy metal translocating P-type ATPase [Atopococcus tabaci]
MFTYLRTTRPGQFLVIGILFTILGFVAGGIYSRLAFYAAIFFLGFFAAKQAMVETVTSKSPNVDLLMILAALGAVVINYESEGAMLLLIFAGAEFLENFATDKSTNAIKELMAHVPSVAQVLQANGEVVEVPTEELKIGDIAVVSKGAQIPIDGLIDRKTQINEAALTGESLPVEKTEGDEVFAGTLNEGNAFHLTVNKTSDQTVFSNIIRMVEEAQSRPSKISKFIDRFEKQYVIGVLIAVPLFIFALYFFSNFAFEDAFYRGMVLLTVASPCALVASATPATLSAISNGAKNGVLVKGGAAMEALATMEILYSDKTGTLTFGDFQVMEYQIPESVLPEVVFMEQQSTHPIARAIVQQFSDLKLDGIDQTEPVEEIPGSGLKKGAIKVGKPSAFDGFHDEHQYRSKTTEDHTTVLVAEGQNIVGYIALSDQIRPEAIEAVDGFQEEGIQVELLTGDNQAVAEKVAGEVGVDAFAAACLPEDKINFILRSQEDGQVVGMVGDGINDAPALATADIGVAMGSGSSVAMESADVVIVKNDLMKLLYSYRLSHRLNTIIKQNVVFAVGVIVVLIVLNLLGYLDLPAGVVFHEGSTILVILNGLRLLRMEDKSAAAQPAGEKPVQI